MLIFQEKDHIYPGYADYMLLINAIMFKIPYILWKYFEGGIMQKFKDDEDDKKDQEKDIGKSNYYFKISPLDGACL